jgi:ribonuclease VapC
MSIELVAVDAEQAKVARRAFSRFGMGQHPAGLNYGDCFAYALAVVLGEPLLCKGDDFPHTDVTALIPRSSA